jgi:hypothetical protein
MFGFDSFTLAVLGSALVVLAVFAILILVDKGKPATAPAPVSAPAKVAGKR